jgi:hypothetical protein
LAEYVLLTQRLMGYYQIMLFLQGLLECLMEKIFSHIKLDIKDPATIAHDGCFQEAIKATMPLNHTTADVRWLWALGIAKEDQQESHRPTRQSGRSFRTQGRSRRRCRQPLEC